MPFASHVLAAGSSPLLASAIVGGGQTGVVATGSTSADAFQLSASWAAITTSSASTGVLLPNNASGIAFGGIRNDSGQTIKVYPPSGCTINAAASSVDVLTAKTFVWFFTSATTVAGGSLA